jgi:hypothetical protein
MMRKSIVAGMAIAVSLAAAGTAQADSNTTTFEDFNLGSVNGQFDWKSAAVGDLPGGVTYDQEVVAHNGGKALRVSNAVTNGEFHFQTYSKPTVEKAGENGDFNVITNQFTFRSTSAVMQPGLAMSISPSEGEGARMSYVRLEDRFDGVRVFFADTPNEDTSVSFTDKWIATLDRARPHTIKFVTTFVRGNDNDIVRVYIDGDLMTCGTSWENYYRFGEQNAVMPSDRLIWRLSGTAVPANKGNGFLFDDVMSATSANHDPVACPPTGPAGEDGTDGANGIDGKNGTNGVDGKNGSSGANGIDGKDGATTIIQRSGPTGSKLVGDTLRTIRVSVPKGAKFLGAKATLRNKRLPVRGRTIKVDLRGKPASNYNVFITVKYKKRGATHTVRSTRNLSVHTVR